MQKFINCMSTECDKTLISYIYFVAVQFVKVNSVRNCKLCTFITHSSNHNWEWFRSKRPL